MTDIYKVFEFKNTKKVLWESKPCRSFREAHKIKQLKEKVNTKKNITYCVEIIKPEREIKKQQKFLK